MEKNKTRMMTDPRDKRGLPDQYKKQMQEAPGIQSEMRPVPDSGEEWYEGCGRLQGRHALITGGDSGIGRAVAIAYAREGARVAINYLEEESGDTRSLAALLKKERIEIVLLPGDIRDESKAKEIVRRAAEKLGGLDILVLNAGVQTANKKMQEVTKEQLIDTFTVNVFSPFWMVQEASPLMPPGSSIIFTASSEFYKPAAKLMEYASSKFAVVGLSKAIAKELIDEGIRVNTVCPGSTWTPLEISGGLLKEDIPGHGTACLMQRAAQPYELAGIYVYLGSEESSYVTCATFGVDGGMQGA